MPIVRRSAAISARRPPSHEPVLRGRVGALAGEPCRERVCDARHLDPRPAHAERQQPRDRQAEPQAYGVGQHRNGEPDRDGDGDRHREGEQRRHAQAAPPQPRPVGPVIGHQDGWVNSSRLPSGSRVNVCRMVVSPTAFASGTSTPGRAQRRDHGVDVTHQERDVLPVVHRHLGLDQVDLPTVARVEPGAGEREVGPRQHPHAQDVAVEHQRTLRVGDVQRDVVDVGDEHDHTVPNPPGRDRRVLAPRCSRSRLGPVVTRVRGSPGMGAPRSWDQQWWDRRRFGLLVHTSTAAVPAWAPIGQYAEWYRAHLDGGAKDVLLHPSPMVETIAHHLDRWAHVERFDDFIEFLTFDEYDPDAWTQLAIDAGMTYTVMVAKHHDGLCWWDAPDTEHTVVHAGPRRNVLGEYAAACERAEPPARHLLLVARLERHPLPVVPVRRQRCPPARARPRPSLRVEDAVGRRPLGRRREPLAQRRPHRRGATDRSVDRGERPVVGRRPRGAQLRVPPPRRHPRGPVGDAARARLELRVQPGRVHRPPADARRHRRAAHRGGREGRPPAVVDRARRSRRDPARARRAAPAGRRVGAGHQSLVDRGRPWRTWGDAAARYIVLDDDLHAIDVDGHGRFEALGRSAGRVVAVTRVDGGGVERPVDFEQDDRGLRLVLRSRHLGDGHDAAGVRTAVYRIALEPVPPPPIELFPSAPAAPIELATVLADATAGQIVQLGDGIYIGPAAHPRRRHRARPGAVANDRRRVRERRDRARSQQPPSSTAPSSGGGHRIAWLPKVVAKLAGVHGVLLGCRIDGHVEVAAPTAGSRRAALSGVLARGVDRVTVTRCTSTGMSWDCAIDLEGGTGHLVESCDITRCSRRSGSPRRSAAMIRGNRIRATVVGRAGDRHRGHRGGGELDRAHHARGRRRRRHARRGHRERRARRRQRLHRAARRRPTSPSPATTGNGSASACSRGTPASSATTTTPSSTSPTLRSRSARDF